MTGLAVRGVGQPQQALGSGSATTNNRKLQQWFPERTNVSSEKCSEVFQFDVSTPSSYFMSAKTRETYTANILIKLTAHISTKQETGESSAVFLFQFLKPYQKNLLERKKTQTEITALHPLVWSFQCCLIQERLMILTLKVLGEQTQSHSQRIFVVVLIDCVNYLTYSCMLPFMAPSGLVTT